MANKKIDAIRVDIKRGDSGLLFATSSNLRGLLLARKSREELDSGLPGAIAAHYEHKGIRVQVKRSSDDSDTWDVITTDVLAPAQ